MTIRLQRRPVTQRLGRLWIRRTGSKTYDVMFRPTGNGEFRILSEDGLHALLWGAPTLERMRKLGL